MNIPHIMHAFVLAGHGDFDTLVFHEDWLVPVPCQQEVLIKGADVTRCRWWLISWVVPHSAATYPLRQLHDAQKAFIERTHSGNIVVTMDE